VNGRRRAIAIGGAVALLLGAVGWGAGGLERIYAAVFGPPDLGPVNFATLTRRRTPNDALACPEGFCGAAAVDLPSPAFPVPPERLRVIVADVAAAEPGVEQVGRDGLDDRYVVRTRLMRFPDTVNVRIIDLTGGRSTLALYSRSQIGASDLGANKARIRRWLQRIEELASRPPAVSGD
jgi:uncharacterized protein (DUF1499 family)